eukprot:GEMP01018754.1.p1 GENE.GEMP01018754.1~~GEMP01018754.1.p1  ORF type:complete len:478 (+),score=84.80 GEMP01018754.1:418-1851(+)
MDPERPAAKKVKVDMRMDHIPADPRDFLRSKLDADDKLADELDAMDPIRHLRNEYVMPTMESLATVEEDDAIKEALLKGGSKECIYLCGNSLGLMPKVARELITAELDVWGKVGALGHVLGKYKWRYIDEVPNPSMARVVGAKNSEVVVMNTLTVNLHTLLTTFYRPTKDRYKIVYEDKAFPSDFHAFESHVKLHNQDLKTALCPILPRNGEHTLRTEDICAALDDSVAVVFFAGVQYYTGQLFDIKAITEAAHKVGAYALFDCAHSVGNAELELHDWDVDGACWCNYKYINAGPGGIGGFFIHEKHHSDKTLHHQGWWGHEQETRFNMDHVYIPTGGNSAQSFQCSNPGMWQMMGIIGALQIFDKTSMKELRRKSVVLTSYLEVLLEQRFPKGKTFEIITPLDINSRGAQLSLLFLGSEEHCHRIHRSLSARGVVMDYRKPNVLRPAPVPMYISFRDVYRFVDSLVTAVQECQDAI